MTIVQRMQKEHWTAQSTFSPPSRRKDLVVEIMEGEAMLYDPATAHTHRLNQSALAVWQQCDGRKTTIDLAHLLTETYAIDQETVLDHVEQLVAMFAEANLLELDDRS